MKKIIFAALFMLSGMASAQTQINVLYLFSKAAVEYVSLMGGGATIASVANDMNSTVNGLYLTSGINARVNVVGTVNGQWCCGGYDAMLTLQSMEIKGALGWVQNDIRTNAIRDGTGADIVVLVGDFDRGIANPPNDVPGQSLSSGGPCTTTAKKPKAGFVGINIAYQLYMTQQTLLAHEIAHQLCMDVPHAGWYRKMGTTQQDCSVRWSIEYGSDFDSTFPGQTTACWKREQPDQPCSPSGHAAVVTWAGGLSCTYANGSTHTGQGTTYWTEDVTCPNSSSVNIRANRYADVTTGAFTCSNAVQIPYFAGAVLPAQYAGGTTLVNTVAAMNAQAPLTAQFRNTKLAPTMLHRIGAMLGWFD